MSGILSEQKAPKQNAIMISSKDGWSKLPQIRVPAPRERRYNVLPSKVPPRLARRTRCKISFTHRSEIDAYGNDDGTDPRYCGIIRKNGVRARIHIYTHTPCLRHCGILEHQADPRRIIPPKRELRLMNRCGICIVKRARL